MLEEVAEVQEAPALAEMAQLMLLDIHQREEDEERRTNCPLLNYIVRIFDAFQHYIKILENL